MHPVLLEAAKVVLILLPGNVRRVIVGDKHGTFVGLASDATTAASTWLDAPPIKGVPAPGIGTRISRVTDQMSQGFAVRRAPSHLPAFWSTHGAKRQLDPMLPQVARDGTDAPQDSELLQDQTQGALDLLVGIELQFAVRPEDIARRRLPQPFATAAPIQPAGLHTLLELVQFETSHEAFDRQDHAIIEVMWMVQSILVGEQGVERGANLDQTATLLVFTGQAVDLEAEDQADVAQGDL